MARKSGKTTMTRRGVTYRIERNEDGTFGRFIPTGKAAATKKASKKTASRKASAKTSNRKASKGGKTAGRRAGR
jgi:hypothetical protein